MPMVKRHAFLGAGFIATLLVLVPAAWAVGWVNVDRRRFISTNSPLSRF
jgi:hypothetical protein